jgi:hypothetical protein
MLCNNNARLTIVMTMLDPYDYSEFKKLCADSGVEPLAFGEYAQKVEAVLSAVEAYPDMPIVDAYMQFVKNNAGHLSAPPIAVDDPKTVRSSQVKHEETPSQPTSSSGCGTCGGGKVR